MSDKEFQKKVEELQMLDHNLTSLISQKQSIQFELNEINNAQSELNKSQGDVYRIVSGMMIKSDKKKLLEELSEKEKVISSKISSFEKQEKIIEEKISLMQKDINSSLAKTKR